MIERDHPNLSLRRQCVLLGADRAKLYRQTKGLSKEDLELMRWMDELSLEDPTAGSRRCRDLLRLQGRKVSRKRLRRLRRIMGLEGLRPKRKLSCPARGAQVFPYLLTGLEINHPNQVWCTDITYLPMRRGFMYLAAIVDWHSRKVLGWALSNTCDTALCLAALEMALATAGTAPEILNSDQGCQYTSAEWTGRLTGLGVKISMDGKGRWLDNVVVERFWWSLKHEDVYLQDYETIPALRAGLNAYIGRFNSWRPHQALDGITPDMAYNNNRKIANVA
jgi:putative transposase